MADRTGVYRDSANKTLEDYPRPSVAVDTAVFTVSAGTLQVVLTDRDDDLRLPGTFLLPEELLVGAAVRALETKMGLVGIVPRQLHVFDRLGRDDRGWVLSVAHVAAVAAERLTETDRFLLVPVEDVPRLELRYDHADIVDEALRWLRAEYADTADSLHLLGEEFTLLQLEQVHEAVAGKPLTIDGFRRRMVRNGRVVETGRTSAGTIGKPARIYRRASA